MQSHQPKLVSVVTPVYNGARYLVECIESVLAQTYNEFEYVICENHSTDETPAIVARYAAADARLRIVSPERFLPQVANWNFAVRQISPASAYVKFVHADDTLEPGCLERMVALADAHPSVGFVGSLRRTSDGEIDLDGVPTSVEVVPGRWLVRHQLLGGTYTTGPPSATLMRRDLVPGDGPLYDESYLHTDDALSYTALLDWDFGYVGEPLTTIRLHAASTTTWATRVGTWLPEHIRMALEVGPHVLAPQEFDRAVARWERGYALTLLKWTLTLKLVRDREVQRYHRRALALLARAARGAGRPLSRTLRAYARVLGEPPASENASMSAEVTPVRGAGTAQGDDVPSLAPGPPA